MAKYLLPLLCLVVSCSPIPSAQCSTDVDCGEDLICDDGICMAGPRPDAGTGCTSDETRPCGPAAVGVCKPGVRRCMNGVFETSCFGEVTATDETCNGLDDDCDGEVDDGATTTFFVDSDGDGFGSSAVGAGTVQACEKPMGFSANASDCDDSNAMRKPTATEVCDPSNVDEDCDGVANEGCGCANVGMTQACCSGRGTQTCTAQDGGAALSMCTVRPALELCNGIDDDCDGQADEMFSVSSPDGGVPALDAGIVLADGGCSIGVGACARTAAVSCVQGSLRCPAVAGTPGTEVCNGIDDNCDGQTDEGSTGLCAATGQTCNAGTCECPTGQTVCGASCETLGGSCSAGVGACARNGSIACVSGGPACDAVPGAPTTEICDAIDNNCDGTIDEGVTITCLVDADNDKANGGTSISNHCPDNSRAAFGFCPTGYVAPSTATNVDCDDNNAAIYRVVSTQTDGDNDGWCNGGTMMECIGASAPQGRRTSDSCSGSTDCDDANANAWTLGLTRADQDGDGYCLGAATNTCNGTTAPAGRRLPTSCMATDDCNDTSAAQFTVRTVRTDADGDSYCVASSFSQCGGASVGAGTRLATTCNAIDDCNDGSAAQFTMRTVRNDGDNDGYCAGVNFGQCGGAAAGAGTRVAITCQATDDCNDGVAAQFILRTVRNDADGDGYCAGATAQQCGGAAPNGGTRVATACNATDDCNDGSATQFISRSVRSDADNDGFCVNAAFTQCGGAAPNSGTRLASTCDTSADDCRDTNPVATTTCFLPGAYRSATQTKQCGFGFAPTQNFTITGVSNYCPPGFSRFGGPTAVKTAGDPSPSCTASSDTNISMTCNALVLGSFSCEIQGDCIAN